MGNSMASSFQNFSLLNLTSFIPSSGTLNVDVKIMLKSMKCGP